MTKCEYFDKCGFFKKHGKELNETCKILVDNYCFGKKKNLCQRLLYFTTQHKIPSDDMAPNGIDLSGKQ